MNNKLPITSVKQTVLYRFVNTTNKYAIHLQGQRQRCKVSSILLAMSWCCGTLSPYREEQQCHHCQVSTDFAGITTTPQHCGSNSISVEYISHHDHRFTQSHSNHAPPPASTYTTECTLAAKPMSKNISLTAAVPPTPFLSLQCRKQTNLIVAVAVTVATTQVCYRNDELLVWRGAKFGVLFVKLQICTLCAARFQSVTLVQVTIIGALLSCCCIG